MLKSINNISECTRIRSGRRPSLTCVCLKLVVFVFHPLSGHIFRSASAFVSDSMYLSICICKCICVSAFFSLSALQNVFITIRLPLLLLQPLPLPPIGQMCQSWNVMINDANMWARLCLCLYDSQSGCESGYLCLYGSNAFRGQRQKQPGDRAGHGNGNGNGYVLSR